ncbi:Cell division coordinator CpoB [Candidatus Entotheonellaceae bacterium PAL068K]
MVQGTTGRNQWLSRLSVGVWGLLLCLSAPTFRHAVTVLHHLGLSFLQARQYKAALAAFVHFLEQFSGGRERQHSVLHLATVYFAQGRFADALPLHQQLLQMQVPPVASATLHLQLGHCYFFLQQFEAAQHPYHLVVQDFPQSREAPLAHYRIGVVALVLQQFEAARQQFQIVLHTYPPGPATRRAHYALAWSFYHTRAGGRGRRLFATSQRREGRRGRLLARLQTALFRAGETDEALHRYDEAIGMYRRVAATNPENRRGRFAAERVKYLKAKMAKSEAQQG